MKKFACICMAAVLSASVLVGCSANSVPDTNSTSESDSTNVSGVTAGKVIVNFEGTVRQSSFLRIPFLRAIPTQTMR